MSTFAKLNYRSDLYSKFRPVYSSALFDTIYTFHQRHGNHFQTALDVATGTGQIAQHLSLKFKQVHATDISSTMISSAVARDNITYSVQSAEDMAFKESSVDLITVGQAFHWFKHDAFFEKAKRVLRPDGTLAILGYGFVTVQDSPEATKLIKDLGEKTFKHDWEPGRQWVNNLLRDIHYPFETTEWHITPKSADTTHLNHDSNDKEFMTMEITLGGLENYIKTWSSYFNYMKRTGNSEDPVDKVITEIKSIMKLEGSDDILRIEFPTALILCKNKKHH